MDFINNLKKLPDELINHIFYMSNPRLNEKLKEELLVEASHMMLYMHNLKWESGYDKFISKTHDLNNYDDKETFISTSITRNDESLVTCTLYRYM